MPQTVAVNRFGPDTYEVEETIDGGQLTEFGTGGKIKVCTANSTKWLGVALFRGEPATTTGEDTVYGYVRIGTDVPRPEIPVGWTGTYKLKAGEALNPGDVVYPGAAGVVQKTTTTGRAVGIVVETAGIASGAYGKVRLFNGK